jgi:hypothetical protein
MAKDLLVTMEDHPGMLADMGEALGNAGINLEGLAGFAVEGRGIVHILVEDAGAARSALESAGIKVEGESDVLVMDMTGDAATPGAMGRAARRVADAGVNLTFGYMATGNRAVIGADDIAKAKAALGI